MGSKFLQNIPLTRVAKMKNKPLFNIHCVNISCIFCPYCLIVKYASLYSVRCKSNKRKYRLHQPVQVVFSSMHSVVHALVCTAQKHHLVSDVQQPTLSQNLHDQTW